MQQEENQEYEWISVSCLAQRLNKSTQTIYNMIKDGLLETMNFERGTKNGILVKYPREN